MDRAEILALEEQALNAWPALETLMVGGWAVRFAGGCTKRANSANALAPDMPFQQVRAATEALYACRELPTIFRISPLAPAEAETDLDDHGYALVDPSLVMTTPLTNCGSPAGVTIEPTASPQWLDGLGQANDVSAPMRPYHDAILRSIGHPSAFASLRRGSEVVAFGLAVNERGRIGLFNIAVDSRHRGQGHGRAITLALMHWGTRFGAKSAYLQIQADNMVAHSLYGSLGFTAAYPYHYRIAPLR